METEASIEYEIRERDGKFWVGHSDESGEWWDADSESFESEEDAELFLAVILDQE